MRMLLAIGYLNNRKFDCDFTHKNVEDNVRSAYINARTYLRMFSNLNATVHVFLFNKKLM
jgi:hypothetical protein